MRPNHTILLHLFLILFGAISLFGQTDYLDFRGELRSWPDSPRPQFSTQLESLSDGENTYRSFVLTGNGMTLVLPYEDGVFGLPPSPRYSACFSHRVVPDFVLGISVFRKGTFLTELSDDGLRGYLKALLVRLPKDTTIKILIGPDEAEHRLTYPILGEFPRHIVYDTIEEKTGVSYRRGEYFIEHKDSLIVVTYQNRPSSFDTMSAFVYPIVARMYLQ